VVQWHLMDSSITAFRYGSFCAVAKGTGPSKSRRLASSSSLSFE
jgi:hypothetical protein